MQDAHQNDERIHRDLVDGFHQSQAHQARIFAAKNQQYGWRNIAAVGFKGIVSRMEDKFARLKSGFIGGEAVDDALVDLSNYATIARMVLAGRWPTVAAATDTFVLMAKQCIEGVARMAEPAKAGDVGYDLPSAREVVLPARSERPVYVHTGFAIKAPDGTWSLITARSSTVRRGIMVPNGIIDNGYTGELLVPCVNLTGEDIVIKAGERIAQLILFPMVTPKLTMVQELPSTERGASGFGSTGAMAPSAAYPFEVKGTGDGSTTIVVQDGAK